VSETRPHPLGAYVAGGQVRSVEDYDPMSPDGVPLPPVLENEPAPVREVTPGRRHFEAEPVRLFLRPLLVLVLVLVTASMAGRVTPDWIMAADAVAAMAGWLGIERLRANVYSRRGADRKAERAARAAAAAGRDAWARTITTETSAYRLGPLR